MDGMAETIEEVRNVIPLPHGTQHRIEELQQQRRIASLQLQAIDSTIRAVLDTVTEALGVPDGWQLRDPSVGFVPPAEQAEE